MSEIYYDKLLKQYNDQNIKENYFQIIPKMMLLDKQFDELFEKFQFKGEATMMYFIASRLFRIRQLTDQIFKSDIMTNQTYDKFDNLLNEFKIKIKHYYN